MSQVYGPRQYPEKLIPKFILLAMEDKQLPVHGGGDQERSFIHAADVAHAFDVMLHKGSTGETYNIGTGNERTVLFVAESICRVLGKNPEELVDHVEVSTEKLEPCGGAPCTIWAWCPLGDDCGSFETPKLTQASPAAHCFGPSRRTAFIRTCGTISTTRSFGNLAGGP